MATKKTATPKPKKPARSAPKKRVPASDKATIKGAVDVLLKYVATYESDTFSASMLDLTSNEAQQITRRLIVRALADVDGVTLAAILFDMRKSQ